MLSSLQVVVTLPFLILSFILGAKTYQAGLNAGKGEKTEPIIFPKRVKKPIPSKDLDRINQILDNIDRYDGTERGQEDIV